MCFSVGAARCRARQGAVTGEKHKTKGRKTSVPASSRGSFERARRKTRIAADGQLRDAPQGEHGGVLYADRVVTDDGCTGSHSPNVDENGHKGERLNAHKAHHRIPHEKLCKMMCLVGRWVPSVVRTTVIRVRIAVVVMPSAGGGCRHVTSRHENDRKAAPFRTHRTSTDRGSNSLQDAAVFVLLSVFYAENDRFQARLGRFGHRVLAWSAALGEIREVLAPQRLRMGGRFAHRWKEREKLRKMVSLPAL